MFKNYWQNIWKTLTRISIKGRSTKQEVVRFFVFRLLLVVLSFLLLQLPSVFISQKAGAAMPLEQSLPILLYLLCFGGLFFIISLWSTIAEIALNVRRFHDFNKSGWLVLLYWILVLITGIVIAVFILVFIGIAYDMQKETIKSFSPIVSNIIAYGAYIILTCICMFIKGTDGPNKYGDAVIENND